MEKRKLVIIGSGPAGYTAAIYAARANLEPFLFAGFESGPGGQLMTTTDVENFPGFPDGIMGPDMMACFQKQAERFGTKVVFEDVISVDLSKRPFKIKSESYEFEAEAVIIATGATAKRLQTDGADKFWQKGVSACAICDGALKIFREKPLYVIGGGDTAVEEATYLTKFGSQVFIVHRRGELRASKIMAEKAMKNPKITILWNSEIVKIDGDQGVTKVVVKDVVTGKTEEREAAGVFFAIGHQPNTGFLKNQVPLTESGYIVVVPGSSVTSIPGVFAAGDVQDHVYRQAVTAAGSGCMSALDAERWLSDEGII